MKSTALANYRYLPARLTPEDVAALLGMQAENVAVLVRHRLLEPLGHPPHNGPKYLAASIVLELSHDVKWLAKASDCLVRCGFRRTPRNAALKVAGFHSTLPGRF